jgi:hypothetical protein
MHIRACGDSPEDASRKSIYATYQNGGSCGATYWVGPGVTGVPGRNELWLVGFSDVPCRPENTRAKDFLRCAVIDDWKRGVQLFFSEFPRTSTMVAEG